MRLLCARRPAEDVIAAPETPPEIKTQLRSIQQARDYAKEIGLSVGSQYTEYVPWPGDRIITSLVVAEPDSVDARPFDYPIVGKLPYRGFFDVDRAEREAESFRKRGYDVCLLAIPAYSTLGYFADPITDPMLRGGEGPAVETVLHELVHATIFVDGDADLNESAASFVGEEASVEFFRSDPDKARLRRGQVEERRLVRGEILDFRTQIQERYKRAKTTGPALLPEERKVLEEAFRARLAALPLSFRDPEQLARSARLNDACLALTGTYYSDLAQHQEVFERAEGDLPLFILQLKSAAEHENPRAAFFAPSEASSSPRE
jgi:predicted aminopeptidase